MSNYDYLIVGAGLFGSVFAHEATKAGKSCLVVDRREHIGGNCYTRSLEGIEVHEYGAHIFRTAKREVWEYMQQFCEFNHFVNSPIANYHGEIYNLPFNMNTFSKMWGISTPDEAKAIIDSQRKAAGDASGISTASAAGTTASAADSARDTASEPQNLEEHVISLVGTDVYEKLVKGYTEKQWGKPCTELPASIIRRLPLRFIYDNNYYHDPYQGIPKGGFTAIFEKLLAGCDVKLGVDFFDARAELSSQADTILYTGAIDAFYEYCFGPLEYRSLRFEHKLLDTSNYQGVAVVNYTDGETPYTRSIEHKHFEFGTQEKSVVSWEYPISWQPGDEPYYPMEDEANKERYRLYEEKAQGEERIFFGGRLGEYRYYDMQDTVISALQLSHRLLLA